MLKKIFLTLGILFAVLVLGIVGLLFWAQQAGSKQQERFFQAVMSGDPNTVIVLCDPVLREQIDAPVLAAWMAEVRKQLGSYQGLSKTDFATNAKSTGQGTSVASKGTVHFEKGDAKSDLEFQNDLLVRFSIDSDKLPPNWFTGPSDPALYRERGEQFIRKFFARDVKGASAMMHEELRRNLPEDKLQTMIDRVTGAAGPLKSVAFKDAKFEGGKDQTLVVSYRVDCDRESLDATVEFQFAGLKGHLLGFDFKNAKRANGKE